MSCKKCGHKLILGRAFVDYINPDPEPYESDQEVEIEDISFNDFLDVHYCEGCEIIHDIWDDSGKHIGARLETEVAKLKAERDNLQMTLRSLKMRGDDV